MSLINNTTISTLDTQSSTQVTNPQINNTSQVSPIDISNNTNVNVLEMQSDIEVSTTLIDSAVQISTTTLAFSISPQISNITIGNPTDFVDLITNQSIDGQKTFLKDLIANNDIYFKFQGTKISLNALFQNYYNKNAIDTLLNDIKHLITTTVIIDW